MIYKMVYDFNNLQTYIIYKDIKNAKLGQNAWLVLE